MDGYLKKPLLELEEQLKFIALETDNPLTGSELSIQLTKKIINNLGMMGHVSRTTKIYGKILPKRISTEMQILKSKMSANEEYKIGFVGEVNLFPFIVNFAHQNE